jgi:hypothetical protein
MAQANDSSTHTLPLMVEAPHSCLEEGCLSHLRGLRPG